RRRQDAESANGEKFEQTALDKLVQELLDRYNGWRSLAFDPRDPLTLSQIAEPGSRGRLIRQITNAIEVVSRQNAQGQTFSGRLEGLASALGGDSQTPLVREIVGVLTSLERLRSMGHQLFQQYNGSLEGAEASGITLEEANKTIAEFRTASKLLADQLRNHKTRIFEDTGGLSPAQLQSFRPMFRELA